MKKKQTNRHKEAHGKELADALQVHAETINCVDAINKIMRDYHPVVMGIVLVSGLEAFKKSYKEEALRVSEMYPKLASFLKDI